jgi:hypothetical protein
MMRSKSGSALAAFVAVLAIGVVMSASASAALPEFVPGAKESFPATFTTTAGPSTWSLPGENSWSCSSIAGAGTISSAKSVTSTTLDFKGCGFERLGSKIWCTSPGAEKGEIRTTASEGTLVYTSKAAKTVGILFKPTGSFSCLATGEIRGSIVLPITSVNTRTSEFWLDSTLGNKGYENEAGEKKTATLETNWTRETFGPLYWVFESKLHTNKNLEIKA